MELGTLIVCNYAFWRRCVYTVRLFLLSVEHNQASASDVPRNENFSRQGRYTTKWWGVTIAVRMGFPWKAISFLIFSSSTWQRVQSLFSAKGRRSNSSACTPFIARISLDDGEWGDSERLLPNWPTMRVFLSAAATPQIIFLMSTRNWSNFPACRPQLVTLRPMISVDFRTNHGDLTYW